MLRIFLYLYPFFLLATGESFMEQKATFAAGCFWGVEEVFRKLEGVISTSVGYEGGDVDHPTYHAVCTGKTGHAEVVQVVFDPDVISFEKLVDIFFETHDPTTRNRQGPDIGTQYRSAIFYHTEEQKRVAEEILAKHNPRFQGQIVTEIVPASTFYIAEEYHQKYIQKKKGE